jgi:biotin operon repressor
MRSNERRTDVAQTGPRSSELILMARAARRYYVDDVSKTDIADELGISRFRVARLIDAARRNGMVTIRVDPPVGIDAEMSIELKRRFGLEQAVVVDTPDHHPEALRSRLGEVAAEVLQDVVTDADVLGLAWARSLRGIGTSIRGLAPCPVVQLTGAMPGPDGSDVIELVRRVAAAGGRTSSMPRSWLRTCPRREWCVGSRTCPARASSPPGSRSPSWGSERGGPGCRRSSTWSTPRPGSEPATTARSVRSPVR